MFRIKRLRVVFLPQEVWDFSQGDGDELKFEEQATGGEEPSRREEQCQYNTRCWEVSEKELNIEPKRVALVQ